MMLILSVQNGHPSSGAAYTYTSNAETLQLFWEFPRHDRLKDSLLDGISKRPSQPVN